MAEIIELHRTCETPAPASMIDWLRRRLAALRLRRSRIGNADELPDRMRRDMGLAPSMQEPGRHYRDYLASHGS